MFPIHPVLRPNGPPPTGTCTRSQDTPVCGSGRLGSSDTVFLSEPAASPRRARARGRDAELAVKRMYPPADRRPTNPLWQATLPSWTLRGQQRALPGTTAGSPGRVTGPLLFPPRSAQHGVSQPHVTRELTDGWLGMCSGNSRDSGLRKVQKLQGRRHTHPGALTGPASSPRGCHQDGGGNAVRDEGS